MRITVSAPTTLGAALASTVCAPKPCVTSSETRTGLAPAPRPQPASASVATRATLARIASARDTHPHVLAAAACTQTDASALTAFGLLTVRVKRPARVNDSAALPFA